MSTKQGDSIPHADDRCPPSRFTGPIEPTAKRDRPLTDSTHHPALLAARIERTRLAARIATLERTLEASERRRQAIINQYERLLADRTASTESSTHDADSQSRSLLTRLFDR